MFSLLRDVTIYVGGTKGSSTNPTTIKTREKLIKKTCKLHVELKLREKELCDNHDLWALYVYSEIIINIYVETSVIRKLKHVKLFDTLVIFLTNFSLLTIPSHKHLFNLQICLSPTFTKNSTHPKPSLVTNNNINHKQETDEVAR